MSEDYRQHLRLCLNSRVYIDLAGPPLPGEDPGEILLCKTLDISYGGLQVSVTRALAVGALLHIGIEFPAVKETLHMVSEVMWCSCNDDPETGWTAGFKLLNSEDSDVQRWHELLLHV
jgi:hypothetical protein